MKKILLTCGAGASSGFMAQSMRKAALKHGYKLDIMAKSDAEISEYLDGASILLIGPHLKYALDKFEKMAKPFGVPVQVISQEIYGELNGEALLNLVIKELNWTKNDLIDSSTSQKSSVKPEIPDVITNEDEKKSEVKEKGFMGWMKNSFAPKMNSLTKNVWVSSVQESIMALLPFIMVGSLSSLVNVFKNWFHWIPDISLINSFTFGLLSIFIAFLIPYKVMTKLKIPKLLIPSSLTSLSLYLMLVMPTFEATNIKFVTEKLGAGGMLVSLVVSLFVSYFMYKFANFSFFKQDTAMPDIVVDWLNSMLPIFILLLFGLICYVNHFDIYKVITAVFYPITKMGQTLPGIVICSFLVCFLFSFGISWVMYPIMWPIWMQGIAANAQLAANGQVPTNLNIMEFFHGFLYLGGQGATLMLVLMFCFSHSKKLKAIGRLTIVPSIFNINEPVMFGAPVVWNPILMVPYWMCGIILPIVGYCGFKFGLVNVPTSPFQVWYMPAGLYGYFATNDARAFILTGIILIVSFIIYFPFFKVYESQEVKKEKSEMKLKMAKKA